MSADASVPRRIVELLRNNDRGAGTHLPAQMLADQPRVPRQPVNDAPALLHEKGFLRRERKRG